MSRITISIEQPTGDDLGSLVDIMQRLDIPGSALVVGGYDAVTVTADLDEIRRQKNEAAKWRLEMMMGGYEGSTGHSHWGL